MPSAPAASGPSDPIPARVRTCPSRAAGVPAAEPQDGPAAAGGHLRQLWPRVDRPRITDQVHQGQVLVTVGVEVAEAQVDLMLGGEPLDAGGLRGAPDHRALDLAGEYPQLIDDEPVAHHVLDAEVTGHRHGLHAQCGRAQHHGMTAVLVGADQVAHLRVDQVGDGLPEDPLAHFLHVLGQPSLGRTYRAFDYALELVPPEPVLQRQLHHAQELGRADFPAAQPILGDGRDGEPGHQRPVQVKERADVRAFGAGVDLGHRAGQPQRPGGTLARRGGHEVRRLEARRAVPDVFGAGRGRGRAAARRAGRGRPSSTTSLKPSCRHFSSWSAAVNDAVS